MVYENPFLDTIPTIQSDFYMFMDLFSLIILILLESSFWTKRLFLKNQRPYWVNLLLAVGF